MKAAALPAAFIAIFVIGGAAVADAQTAQASIMSVKIAVADFQKSTDFYVKYFGMKPGARYTETEQGVDWPAPGEGANLILVHDPAGKVTLTPGTAWIVFKVPDAGKTAKALTDAGFAGVSKPVEINFQGHSTVVVVTRDPDGNQIEMLQVGAAL
jgi:catechol 2,3-dioxygenase-like lactoylglutathione lyase family enzyme